MLEGFLNKSLERRHIIIGSRGLLHDGVREVDVELPESLPDGIGGSLPLCIRGLTATRGGMPWVEWLCWPLERV